MEPLDYQKAALAEIVARARAYFRGDWRDLPIKPRWASLLAGPTGTGKTAVAAMAAKVLGTCDPATQSRGYQTSLLRVSAPNWMPSGANNRSTRETIGIVAEHIAKNERTILFVDEIDKLIDRNGDSSWKTYIRGELFDLVDGRWPTGLILPETDDGSPDITIDQLTTRLQDGVFILAAGTFQAWFDDTPSRRTMGFALEENPEKDEISADVIAEGMPRELANRFNSTLIRLPELRAEGYHRIAQDAENNLPERMRATFRAEVAKRIAGAIASKKGARFLEEAMLETLKNLPAAPTPPIPDIFEITPGHDLCTL